MQTGRESESEAKLKQLRKPNRGNQDPASNREGFRKTLQINFEF
jgi:hypothetical protein